MIETRQDTDSILDELIIKKGKHKILTWRQTTHENTCRNQTWTRESQSAWNTPHFMAIRILLKFFKFVERS